MLDVDNDNSDSEDMSWEQLSQQQLNKQSGEKRKQRDEQTKSTLEKLISQAQNQTSQDMQEDSENRLACSTSQQSVRRKRLNNETSNSRSGSSGSDKDDYEWKTQNRKPKKSKQQKISYEQENPLESFPKPNPKIVVLHSPDVQLAKVNPIKIAKALKDAVGQAQGYIKSVGRTGQGGISVHCFTSAQACKLKSISQLGDWLVTCEFAKSETQCKGVISGVPGDISDSEIVAECREYGVIGARRISTKRDGQLRKTLSVTLTFNTPQLPPLVKLGYEVFETKPYIPPVVRCFKCQRLGHFADVCRGTIRCVRCSGPHSYEECTQKDQVHCSRCGGNHSAAYAGCSTMKEEKKIQEIRVTLNISYADAAKAVRPPKDNDSSGKDQVHVSKVTEQSSSKTTNRSDVQMAQKDTNIKAGVNKQQTSHTYMSKSQENPLIQTTVTTEPKKKITMIDASTQTDQDIHVGCQTDTPSQYLQIDHSLVKLMIGTLKIWETKSGKERELGILRFIEQLFPPLSPGINRDKGGGKPTKSQMTSTCKEKGKE